MRKQYNFWPGPVGLDAWDVDRLIELSRGLPVKQAAVASIWELDTSYPIILAVDGRVMDGMHRVVRALVEKRATIAAVQFEIQPAPDFRNCLPEDLPYPTDRLD